MSMWQFNRGFMFNIPSKDEIALIECEPGAAVLDVLDEDVEDFEVRGEGLLKFEVVCGVPEG